MLKTGTLSGEREVMLPEGIGDLATALAGRKVLIIVENLPVPFDRRVWQEARTLRDAGAVVSVICPTGKGFEKRHEVIEGINVYRHPLPVDASTALGYLVEYGAALFWESLLAWKVLFRHGFDVIHGCNPPDLIFLVAWQFKLLGKKYVFDHHDINPELYEAKFNKRGFFWKLMVFLEWLTFKTASVVISTNESYRQIAMRRGGKKLEDTFVVRSGPDISRLKRREPNPEMRRGFRYLIGYVGVMGEQEGIELLLEAASHIIKVKGRTDIGFCLVGGGPSLEKLKVLSEEMGLDHYVEFTGRAPDDVLFDMLSTADVCVNPDRVNPMNDLSTMNKVLEYMAFERPQVQFEVREGRFSAQDTSLYARPNDAIDLADKILELLADEPLRIEMGRKARARIESDLSWGHQIQPLISAYLRVLGHVRR